MADVLFEQGQVAKEMGNFDMARAKIDSAIVQFKKLGMEKSFKQAIKLLNQLEKDANALNHTTK